jgi:hypothetical protein
MFFQLPTLRSVKEQHMNEELKRIHILNFIDLRHNLQRSPAKSLIPELTSGRQPCNMGIQIPNSQMIKVKVLSQNLPGGTEKN